MWRVVPLPFPAKLIEFAAFLLPDTPTLSQSSLASLKPADMGVRK